MPYFDYLKFKDNNKTGSYKTKLFGKEVHTNNPFWYLHSVEELFLQEVYFFNSSNQTLYIIDCGANIGLSILYFKRKFPQCKIVAFEADKKIFSLLEKNIETFGFDNINLINSAVWSEDTYLDFSADGALGGRISNIGEKVLPSSSIKAVALRPFLENTKVDFLKIDIEGAEYEVLLSCREVLKNVDRLFVEYHSVPNGEQFLSELLQIIKQAGFRFHIKGAWESMRHPFEEHRNEFYYDMQLNIFCYR